jgi:TrpR-related protein YerC/YecD
MLFHVTIIEHGSVIILNSKLKDPSVDFLFEAVLALKNKDECYAFFEDLCTVPEIKAMSQRLLVAHMLSSKKVYSDIVAETGASTATISRVNRSLHYGCDGYQMVFQRLQENSKKE